MSRTNPAQATRAIRTQPSFLFLPYTTPPKQQSTFQALRQKWILQLKTKIQPWWMKAKWMKPTVNTMVQNWNALNEARITGSNRELHNILTGSILEHTNKEIQERRKKLAQLDGKFLMRRKDIAQPQLVHWNYLRDPEDAKKSTTTMTNGRSQCTIVYHYTHQSVIRNSSGKIIAGDKTPPIEKKEAVVYEKSPHDSDWKIISISDILGKHDFTIGQAL